MMSKLDLYRITQPELLSGHELRQILTDSCIDLKDFKNFSKTELIEMYKKVAMPLPQRLYWAKKSKEENKNDKSETWKLEEWDINTTLTNPNFNENDNTSSTNSSEKRKKLPQENSSDLLTSSIDETKSVSKKIRLSTSSKEETNCNEVTEDKTNEKNEDSTSTAITKRQKITWP